MQYGVARTTQTMTTQARTVWGVSRVGRVACGTNCRSQPRATEIRKLTVQAAGVRSGKWKAGVQRRSSEPAIDRLCSSDRTESARAVAATIDQVLVQQHMTSRVSYSPSGERDHRSQPLYFANSLQPSTRPACSCHESLCHELLQQLLGLLVVDGQLTGAVERRHDGAHLQ